ncbi:MAG: hypothetical protein AAFO62_12590 [Pseudomonadota bacterium]
MAAAPAAQTSDADSSGTGSNGSGGDEAKPLAALRADLRLIEGAPDVNGAPT